jgi:hypothetical protein
MATRKLARIALAVLLVAGSALLVGCAVSNSDVRYTGISDDALSQVKPGQTTEHRLRETFGEPDEELDTPVGVKILTYNCTMEKDSSFVLFPVVFVNEEKETAYTICFEVKDGVVQRYWKKS